MCIRLLATLFLTLLIGAQPAEAQFWRKAREAAKRGAERAVERETARRADRAVTGMFELGDDAVGCVIGDDACVRQAREEGKEVVYVDEEGTPLPDDQQPTGSPAAPPADADEPADAMRPGEGAWANYDFVPGHRVLYAEDFENDYTGNVPGRIDFHEGIMEVVRLQSGDQALRFSSAGAFAIPLPETLPERFTIEFDAYFPAAWIYLTLGTGPLADGARNYDVFHSDLRGHNGAEFTVSKQFETGIRRGETGGEAMVRVDAFTKDFAPIRITVDGDYAKMYVGEQRVANVPNADIRRADRVLVAINGELEANPSFINNVRIAAGGREILYDRLVADGRVTTHGILFDTGSATIKPESTPTLQDLVRTLNQHADLRLRIEGHTDNTGSAEANQQLSERRAAAVRDYLIQRESIDASRLESAGMGQTVPAADNSTPEGRQTNRRVELVVL